MTNDTDIIYPPPKHLIDDLPAWLDLSTFRAYELEGITPESIAAAHLDNPKDQAFLFLRASAIRQRRHWEATHSRSDRFAGVYLNES